MSFTPPSTDEFVLYGAKIGLPVEECNAWFDHFEANGWKVSGITVMKSWQASMRTWKRNWQSGVFGRSPASNSKPNGADTIVAQKEYDRVLERMKQIRGTYGDHQTWTEQDRVEFTKLRERKLELKQKLNILI